MILYYIRYLDEAKAIRYKKFFDKESRKDFINKNTDLNITDLFEIDTMEERKHD